MEELAVPRTPVDVTERWITALLKRGGHLHNGAVRTVRADRLDPATAAFGSLFRLRLSYAGDVAGLPATMILKLPSDSSASFEFMRTSRGYRVETGFYQDIGASVGLRTPECYGLLFDDVSDRFALLLEDLSAHRAPEAATLLARRDMEAVVRSLAASHAIWWGSPRLSLLAWLRSIAADDASFRRRFPTAWPIVAERLGSTVDRRLGDRVVQLIPQLAQLECQPVTLLHLDLRQENLFFSDAANAPETIVIDWQNVRYGRGPASLASFLGPLLDRETVEQDLVRLYHDELILAGVRGYAFDSCIRDYRLGLVRRFVAPACVLATVDPDSTQGAGIIALLRRMSIASHVDWLARTEDP